MLAADPAAMRAVERAERDDRPDRAMWRSSEPATSVRWMETPCRRPSWLACHQPSTPPCSATTSAMVVLSVVSRTTVCASRVTGPTSRVIADVERCIVGGSPGASLHRVNAPGVVVVQNAWRYWPMCLFPQHGPCRKHERSMEMAPWQRQPSASSRLPSSWAVPLGGCRVHNWTAGPAGWPKHYYYPAQLFTKGREPTSDRGAPRHSTSSGPMATSKPANFVRRAHARDGSPLLDDQVGPKADCARAYLAGVLIPAVGGSDLVDRVAHPVDAQGVGRARDAGRAAGDDDDVVALLGAADLEQRSSTWRTISSVWSTNGPGTSRPPGQRQLRAHDRLRGEREHRIAAVAGHPFSRVAARVKATRYFAPTRSATSAAALAITPPRVLGCQSIAAIGAARGPRSTDDPRHRAHGLDGVVAHARLAREHHGVGAVEHGVGDSVASARVGPGLLIMDSSICVATITGFALRRAISMIRFCRNGTSSSGHPRPGRRGPPSRRRRPRSLVEVVDRLGFSILAITGSSTPSSSMTCGRPRRRWPSARRRARSSRRSGAAPSAGPRCPSPSSPAR